MLRFSVFVLIYILLLGACSFRVGFKDGLNITLIGWVERLNSIRPIGVGDVAVGVIIAALLLVLLNLVVGIV